MQQKKNFGRKITNFEASVKFLATKTFFKSQKISLAANFLKKNELDQINF